MSKSLAKVGSKSLWRNHLTVKGTASVPSEVEYDIWKARASGLSIQDTATHFDIAEATVKASCTKVEKFFESNVTIDIAALKITQHVRLQAMIEVALEEFQASGGVRRKSTKKILHDGEGGEPVVIEETITEIESYRDPRYLTAAKDAMQEQRKIWPGANAPSASAIKHEEVKTTNVNIAAVVNSMTEEEFEALKRVESALSGQESIDAEFSVKED